MEFSYFMPVRLLFGANVIDQLGATAKSYGTHALIVTGRSSTKRSGLLDRSIALLEAAGVRATVFNKVEPNPLTTTVMEGAALARGAGVRPSHRHGRRLHDGCGQGGGLLRGERR